MAIIKPNNNTISAITALPAAISTGSLVLLQTQTVSTEVAEVDFTSNLGTYDTVRIAWNGVKPETDDVHFRLRVSTNGGSSYLTSTYNHAGEYIYSGGSNSSYSNESSYHLLGGGYGNASTESTSGFTELHNLSSTSLYKNINSFPIGVHDLGHGIGAWTGCTVHQTSAINGIRFYFSSGNITAGKLSLYGIKRS